MKTLVSPNSASQNAEITGLFAMFGSSESDGKTSGVNSAGATTRTDAAVDESQKTSETAQLTAILSANADTSRFVIVFPTFQMGLKNDCYQLAKSQGWFSLPKGVYHYRGLTSAMTAFGAIKGLIASLGRIFSADELQSRLVFATDGETELLMHSGGYTHYVFLGTRSHQYVRQVLTHYSDDFEFRFNRENWSVFDKRENQIYSALDPSQADSEVSVTGMDYALIEKIVDPVSHRVILVIGGMWDTGTLAAGNFLVEHREEIFKQFGSGGFQYLLEIVPGSTRVRRIVLSRRPREL